MTGSIRIEFLVNTTSLKHKLEEFPSIPKTTIKYVQAEMVIGNFGESKRIHLSLCLQFSEFNRTISLLIMLG
jgi:hypothetical protein